MQEPYIRQMWESGTVIQNRLTFIFIIISISNESACSGAGPVTDMVRLLVEVMEVSQYPRAVRMLSPPLYREEKLRLAQGE